MNKSMKEEIDLPTSAQQSLTGVFSTFKDITSPKEDHSLKLLLYLTQNMTLKYFYSIFSYISKAKASIMTWSKLEVYFKRKPKIWDKKAFITLTLLAK